MRPGHALSICHRLSFAFQNLCYSYLFIVFFQGILQHVWLPPASGGVGRTSEIP